MYEVSNISTINSLLYRPLRNEYPQDIFPPSNCRISDLGRGDTFYSVQQIATLINSYYKQSEKIAKLLHNKDLHRLCVRIYEFIYHHFQYKADDQLQQLRSPACSWAHREQGIDCKSYTILAGSILRYLGINFYIRQVKQWGYYPDFFTHVYAVVPICQKTNDLEKGYYVIDGTAPHMQESLYIIDKSDYLVMKHIALNGRYNPCIGLSSSIGYTYNPEFTPYSGPSSPANYDPTKWRNMSGAQKRTLVLDYIQKGISMFGSTYSVIKGINQHSGTQIIPDNVRNEQDFQSFLNQQQHSPQGDQNMLMMFMALQSMTNNNSKPQTDYMPYVIGGVGLVLTGVVAYVLLKDDKKR